MEQALADYALVIKTVKETVYNTEQPVVAFGGSYGGMLAAWLRMKYPASVQGAIAVSADNTATPNIALSVSLSLRHSPTVQCAGTAL